MFWQALSFSGGAFIIVASITWWLFYSPIKNVTKHQEQISPAFSATVGILLILWALLLMGGAFWDASMHIQTGEIPAGADFLWPPHIMIYSSFALSLAVGLFSLGKVAIEGQRRRVPGLRALIRNNPYVGSLSLASLYALLSLPGDAIWHELFGIDLTAWSPPHLLIGLLSSTVVVCTLGVIMQNRKNYKSSAQANLLLIILLAMLLNVAYMIGVIEWELAGSLDGLVAVRPQWLYPLVSGAIGFFVLALARKLVPLRWTATAVALIALSVRLAYSVILDATGNVSPTIPLVFLAAAFLLDAFQTTPRTAGDHFWAAGLFALPFAFTSLFQISLRPEIPSFSISDQAATFVGLFVVCLVIGPITEKFSPFLQG